MWKSDAPISGNPFPGDHRPDPTPNSPRAAPSAASSGLAPLRVGSPSADVPAIGASPRSDLSTETVLYDRDALRASAKRPARPVPHVPHASPVHPLDLSMQSAKKLAAEYKTKLENLADYRKAHR